MSFAALNLVFQAFLAQTLNSFTFCLHTTIENVYFKRIVNQFDYICHLKSAIHLVFIVRSSDLGSN